MANCLHFCIYLCLFMFIYVLRRQTSASSSGHDSRNGWWIVLVISNIILKRCVQSKYLKTKQKTLHLLVTFVLHPDTKSNI